MLKHPNELRISTHLSDEKFNAWFKRLIDVEQTVFHEMPACLEQAQATVH